MPRHLKSSLRENGGIAIRPKSPDTIVQLSFTVSPIGDGCIGTVDLETSSPMPGGVSASSGKFASWSDTGCAVGEKSIPLDTPARDGAQSIAAIVASKWTEATYTGTWDDGTPTDLTVTVGSLPATACRDAFTDRVTLPVRVTYETADGRVKSHAEAADLVVAGTAARRPSSSSTRTRRSSATPQRRVCRTRPRTVAP